MKTTSGRTFGALLLAVCLIGGCGRPQQPESTPATDVRGTPLRAPAPTPPETAALGDVSASKPSAPGPPAVPPAAAVEPAPTVAPSVALNPAPENYADYPAVTFDELAGFEYALYAEDAKKVHEIPAKVRALSGKRVAVDGYMMPLAYEAGGAKKFLLMKNQYGCCFAATPKINEWVEVTMEGGAVAEYIQHTLVTVWGVLDVTPESHEGISTGLYKMKATRTEFTEAK